MEHTTRPLSASLAGAHQHWAGGSGLGSDTSDAAAAARSIHGPGFHAPFNEHNRFMSSAGTIERHFLRHIERPPQFTTRRMQQPQGDGASSNAQHGYRFTSTSASATNTQRPHNSSSHQHPTAEKPPPDAVFGAAARALGTAATQRGVPCYSAPVLVRADLTTGRPVTAGAANEASVVTADAGASEPWRTARVRAYAVPTARHGYGEGGMRPPHQSYAFYKYYGFAGRGAATSWGANPSKAVRKRL